MATVKQSSLLIMFFLPFFGFSQTETFNWTDTLLHIKSKRVIEFNYAIDGPCTVVPCNDSSNRSIYDTVEFFLKNHPEIKVEISAHVDWTDDTVTNNELSTSQARRVRNVLVDRGIDGKRISANGYGNSKPLITEYEKRGLSQKQQFFLRQEKILELNCSLLACKMIRINYR